MAIYKYIRTALLMALISLVINCSAQEWTHTTIGNGTKSDIAIIGANQPHIAFMSESANNGFIKHASLESFGFNVTTVALGYFYGPLDIALDQFGRPSIVYHDHDSEELAFANTENGMDWNITQINSPGHDGWDVSLFIDDSRNSHISSIDPGTGLEYMTNENGNWTVELVDNASLDYEYATSIKRSADGTLHIAYFNQENNFLTYARKNGSTWEIQQVADNGKFPSLILGEDNKVHIAYYDDQFPTVGIIKIATLNSSEWEIENIDTLSNVALGFSGARHLVDYKFHNNEHHLAYGDKKLIYYANRKESGWKIEEVLNVLNVPTTELGQQVGLALDNDNNLHLTYWERDNAVSAGGIVKYATRSSLNEIIFTCPISNTYYCQSDTSVLVNGEPEISFNPGLLLNVKYTDNYNISECSSIPDTLIRTWTLSNELGNSSTCDQFIITESFQNIEIRFPEDERFFDYCYQEISTDLSGTVSGVCNRLETTHRDSILTNNCSNFVDFLRLWTVSDNCGNVIKVDTQLIELERVPIFTLSNNPIASEAGLNNGSISIEIECGLPEFSFFWSNGRNTQNIQNLLPGEYSVTVTDGIGCLQSQTINIEETSLSNILSGSINNINGIGIDNFNIQINSLSDNIVLQECDAANNIDFNRCVSAADSITGNVEICISKDDAHDSNLTGLDAVLARRIVLGLDEDPCPYNFIAADVNESGTVTGLDVVQIIQVVLGNKPNFDENSPWLFYKDEVRISCDTVDVSNGNALNLEYIGIKKGDIICEENLVELEDRSTLKTYLLLNKSTNSNSEIALKFEEAILTQVLEFEIEFTNKTDFVQLIDRKNKVQIYQNWSDNNLHCIIIPKDGTQHIDPKSMELVLRLDSDFDDLFIPDLIIHEQSKNSLWDTESREYDIQLRYEQRDIDEITIFPNPFDSKLNILLPDHLLNNNVNFQLFDLSGKLLKEINNLSNSLTLDTRRLNLESGIYLIKVSGNNINYHSKIVVKQ